MTPSAKRDTPTNASGDAPTNANRTAPTNANPTAPAPATASRSSAADAALAGVGVVVIGRNEAPRLAACLESVREAGERVVYVDSASSDGSADIAEQAGIWTIRITEGPFSAARGRQAGFEALSERFPDIRFVQFVDGDSTIGSEWLARGARFLAADPTVGVVVGEMRETQLNDSLLARLVNADWDLPLGEIDAVGGISMMSANAVRDAGGWNPGLVAGEELDLSARLRTRNWRLHRLPDLMTQHDIGVASFRELWKRAVRSGYAYAQLARLHARNGYDRWVRRTLGNVFYGALLPTGTVIAAALFGPAWLLLLLLYPALIIRVAYGRRRRSDAWPFALLYGGLMAAFKFAGALGVLRFLWLSMRGRSARLIEYKSTTPSAGAT